MSLKGIDIFFYYGTHFKCTCKEENCTFRFCWMSYFNKTHFFDLSFSSINTEKLLCVWNIVSFRFDFLFSSQFFFIHFILFSNSFTSNNIEALCIFSSSLFPNGLLFFLPGNILLQIGLIFLLVIFFPFSSLYSNEASIVISFSHPNILKEKKIKLDIFFPNEFSIFSDISSRLYFH